MNIEKESQSIIENFLKEKGIGFNVISDGVTDNNPYYDIFIGSEEAHIQLELSDNRDEENLCAQFWLGGVDKSYDIYHESFFEIKSQEELEGYIEELINATKSYNRLKNKIEALLDKMKEEIDNSQFNNIDFDITIDDIL